MTQTLAIDSRELAMELHNLLREIDPARWKNEIASAAREQLLDIQQKMQELLEYANEADFRSQINQKLLAISTLVEEHMPETNVPTEQIKKEWMSFRKQLMDGYESLSATLKTHQVHIPSLRPTNYKRNVFHVANALGCILLVVYILPPMWIKIVAGSFAVWAWSMEFFRKRSPRLNDFLMKGLSRFAHPHEWHRVNSATWYVTALFILSMTSTPMVCAISVGILGLADPMAAIIGRKYGKTKLVNGRSLEGTLAFAAAGFVAVLLVWLAWFTGSLTFARMLGVALFAVIPAALAELFSKRVDDNLSIPVSAAFGANLFLLFF